MTTGSTANYSYDANGNVTNDGLHSYSYDSENRLVNVDNGAAVYAYDHQNRRYKKTIGSSVTHYVWEGSQVVGEYNGSSGAILAQYGYAGSRMIAKTAFGVTQCFLSDRLSMRLELSDVGVVAGRQGHLPFGEDFGESGTQEKHHFTTYERDSESGTDYAINRQYCPEIGKFSRVDPFEGSGNVANPQSLNRYSYPQNDPINAEDPLGLYPIVDLGGGSFAYQTCSSFGEFVRCEWRIYTEYQPPAKKPTPPCSGSHKAALKGKRLATYDAQRDIVRDKLQHSDACKGYLSEHGIDPAAALSAVNAQNAYDGAKSEISRLEAGLVSPDMDLTNPRMAQIANSCVSAKFKYKGGRLGGETAIWPGEQPASQTTVEERSDVYYGKDISASNILHEALHSLLGAGDFELAQQLNVTLPGNGSTKEISDALHKHGCGGD